MAPEEDIDEPDALAEWVEAEEHGHALGEYMMETEGDVHPDDPGRNVDGTFRRLQPDERSSIENLPEQESD